MLLWDRENIILYNQCHFRWDCYADMNSQATQVSVFFIREQFLWSVKKGQLLQWVIDAFCYLMGSNQFYLLKCQYIYLFIKLYFIKNYIYLLII